MDPVHLHTKSEAPEHLDRVVSQESVGVIPSSYYRSKLFLGTTSAVAISLVCGTGAFSLVAPILAVVNRDLGPDPNYVWIGLVNTLMLAVGYIIVGRLSDLCGRRYFFAGGNCLGLIGAIVCSRATSIPNLIGGNVLLGLAASVQTSIPFVMGELIPMKHRFIATGLLYIFAIPCAVFGPAISYGFVAHTAAGWRWVYYFLIITNACATTCWIVFYHPPTYVMITRKSRWQMIKDFDYIGFLLLVGGLLVFLMGLSWGGSVYPWKSAHVIACIVVGVVSLISFVIYEHVRTLPDPIMPLHLFKNVGWVVAIMMVALAASVFYGFSIVFPMMVFGVYTNDPNYGSILSCAGPAGFVFGTIASGASRFLGPQRWQLIIASFLATPILGCVATATVDNKSTVLPLLIIGSFLIGYVEGVGVTTSSLAIDNQAEIGTAVGIGATMRAVVATIATTIYVVVLTNRLETTIPAVVPPALEQAGLPASSIEAFIAAISTGSFSDVPGVTPTIIAAGTRAYKQAQVDAFRTIFEVAIAFSGSVLTLSFFYPNLKDKMTNDVGALLRDKKAREQIINQIQNKEVDIEHGSKEVASDE